VSLQLPNNFIGFNKNTLAFYVTGLITAVKSFLMQAPAGDNPKNFLGNKKNL
jgi:hypothetical protein